MAMYPSSNIPSYQSLAARVRGMDVEAPFNQAASEMARSRAMDLEALNRQRIEQEQAERAQAMDRGMEILGGNRAAQKRFQQAVERGSQQYNQSVAQMAPQRLAAQMQQEQLAGRYEAQALAQNLQLELARLQRAERELDRQLRREESRKGREHATEGQKRALRTQVGMHKNNLQIQQAQIRSSLRQAQMRQGMFSGGGGPRTASYSTGARNFQDHLRKMGVM